MLDFLQVSIKNPKKDTYVIYPKFWVIKSEDLMIRGKDFYAVWVDEQNIWSTNEDDVIRLIDKELKEYKDRYIEEHGDNIGKISVEYMKDSDTKMIDKFHRYCQSQLRDNFHSLDEKLIFSNTETTRKDYSSKRLSYPLEKTETPAYDELMSVLYSPEERRKIEWAVGSIIAGDSKKIQKFIVLYGAAGTGKSTVLNIIQQLFDGYYTTFDAKALASSSNQFALESFKSNPLVAIQHDGDLSRIEDNTRLNSIVSHEEMTVNAKFQGLYSTRFHSFLFMGTNKPVKITDSKSGLLRRLIDVTPTGDKVHHMTYNKLMKQISFELSGIAYHCWQVYLDDPTRYDNYIPVSMLGATNDFYDFVLDNYLIFKNQPSVSLKQAYEMYNSYCAESNVAYKMPKRIFKEELKSYFEEFTERGRDEQGERVWNIYSRFKTDKFVEEHDPEPDELIKFTKRKSEMDKVCADCLAQYANEDEKPTYKWANVKTTLSELDTSKLHYVKPPRDHIVIDFDIPGEDGKKSFERNLREASKWPTTYAELSKSGGGIHLHYIYDGDVTKLANKYDDHIEIKVFTGGSSLRRKLTKCNGEKISMISSGLPLKEVSTKVVDSKTIKSNEKLHEVIIKIIRKQYPGIPSTVSGIDLITKILDEAYASGIEYDVSNLEKRIFNFASNSTNHASYCMEQVTKMKLMSKDKEIQPLLESNKDDRPIAFFDIEVFPNVWFLNYKQAGKNKPVNRLINPDPDVLREIVDTYRLIGFNSRKYDDHIYYAGLIGYPPPEIYNVSQSIVTGGNGYFKQAWGNISYADVYEMSSKKQSLKKWEIELHIHHKELGLPWDKPVDKSDWARVAEYCDNDVIATEKVFEHIAGDWEAKQILAEMTGLPVIATTNQMTEALVFKGDKNPPLVYTDLSKLFPDYRYEFDEKGKPHNMWKDIDVGFGGYVYSDPGIYGNVGLEDVVSMHPNSIWLLGVFGEKYTKNFKDLVDKRIGYKKTDPAKAKALKIAINSVYGLTSASFPNTFKDPRNVNNIVALRGALMMVSLKEEVEKRGYVVAHIKTDSIKIPDAQEDILKFVEEWGQKYGYSFDREAVYERMCLINDADYIAKIVKKDGTSMWTATGKRFAEPYVFKKLFTHEDIVFDDMCETKEVKTAMYLGEPDYPPEKYQFVGKVGSFCPMIPGKGKNLWVINKADPTKFSHVTGTKGYEWLEAETVKELGLEKYIDTSYYERKVNEAIEKMVEVSSEKAVKWFLSDEPYSCPPFVGGKIK